MPARLLRRLAPLLALLAVVATACGSVAESAALTIGDHEISTDSVQDEFKAIRNNKRYADAVAQQFGESAGTGTGTFDAAFAANVLSLRSYYTILEVWLEDEGEAVTEADVEQAAESVEEQFTQLPGVLARFPKAYRDQLAHQEAVVAKATTVAAKDVEVACVAHILVTTETRTPEEAKALAESLKAQLDGGADFAELAQASSEDPGSKDAGGELGCQPAGVYDPDFEAAVFDQPVGEVGDPVETQFGYHLILVQAREKGGEEAATGEAGQQALNALILDLACAEDLDISVNPRYGRWDRSPCDEGQLAKVSPPRGPKSS